MLIEPFNQRIKPRMIAGIFHEHLVYAGFSTFAFFMFTVATFFSTFQAVGLTLVFALMTVLSGLYLLYVIRHKDDWLMRHAKSSASQEVKAPMMVQDELNT